MAYSMAFNPRNILTALPTAVLSARDRDLEIFRLGVGLRAPKQRDRITAYHALSNFHPEFQEAQIEKLADNMPQRELQALQKKYYQDRTQPLEQRTQETQTEQQGQQVDLLALFESSGGGGGGGGVGEPGSGFFEPREVPSTEELMRASEELTTQFQGLVEQTNLQNPFGRGTPAREALIRERRAGGGFIASEDVTAQEAAEQLLARAVENAPPSVFAGLRTKGKVPSGRNVLFGVPLSASEMRNLPESFQQEALMERGALAQGTSIIEQQNIGTMALARRRAQEREGLSEFETEEFTGRPPPSRLRGKSKVSPAVKIQALQDIATSVAEEFGGQYAGERRAGGGAARETVGLQASEQELPLEYNEMIARGLLEVQEEFADSLADPRGDFINYIRRNPTRGNLEGFRRFIQEQLNPTRVVSRQ